MHNVTNTTASGPDCSKPRIACGSSISRNDHFPSIEGVRRNDIVSSLFLKALLGLLLFDVLGFARNFAGMHRFIRNRKVSTAAPHAKAINDVCTAVNYACAWYPKRVLCLQRSAVTTYLLRHCGVPASMVMGAQLLPFKAHAWTEVDGQAINERREVQTIYTVWERC